MHVECLDIKTPTLGLLSHPPSMRKLSSSFKLSLKLRECQTDFFLNIS